MCTYNPKQSTLLVAALSCCFKGIFGESSKSKIQMSGILKRTNMPSLFAAMLFAVFNSPLHAQGFPTVYCDAPGADLQRAIDNGAEGEKIFLTGVCDDGPYFIFGKNIKLQGYSSTGATLSSAGSDGVLIVRGATVGLRNLTIDAGGSGGGISTEGSSIDLNRVVVQNAPEVGMNIDGSSFAIVIDSEFNDNGYGIAVVGSSNAFLHENTIQRNSIRGVAVVYGSSATVSDSFIIDNQVGVLVSKMSSLVLVGNTIANNVDNGVWVADQYGYLEASGNTIQYNGTDVACEARGIFESPEPQISTTQITSLVGCTVLGTVF